MTHYITVEGIEYITSPPAPHWPIVLIFVICGSSMMWISGIMIVCEKYL